MNTHTPAPWILGEPLPEENRIQIMKKDAPRPDDIAPTWVVANVNLCMGQESEANARLIASAPELLAALQECITEEGATCFAHKDTHPEYMERRINYITNLARAAIANAEGGAK